MALSVDDRCPICHRAGCQSRRDDGPIGYIAACIICGEFKYLDFGSLIHSTLHGVDWHYLSCATRQAWVSGHRIVVLAENTDELIHGHRGTAVTENIERLLRYIGTNIRRPSDSFRIDTETDFPVIDVESPADFRIYLEWLRADGLISLATGSGQQFQVSLMRAGWARLQPPGARIGGTPGTCFVAMWFDTSVTEAYEVGILPAIEQDCGFRALRIDRKHHNNQITDEIMAGIRSAEFMVADFTGHRAGVYYEAGFARGLGREVVYCCREDAFKERHFDTSVINHVVWTDPADLRKKLADRIRATILPKA